MKTIEEKIDEARLSRDKLAKIGVFVGPILGVVYNFVTHDNEGVSFVHEFVNGFAEGAITGSGIGYVLGTISRPYEFVYEILDRLK